VRRRKTHGKRICFPTAHGKGNVFVVHLVLVHGKGNEQANGCKRGNVWWGKMFVVRQGKTHCKLFVCRVFFRHASWESRTTKVFFVVRPI
jgi:hypothetical protein